MAQPVDQTYFDRSTWIKIVLGLLFIFTILLYIHYRQVKIEVLDLGSTAPHYVVSQVDFDFPDDQATSLRRQEAVRNIGRIFYLSDAEIAKRQGDFEKALSQDEGWRKKVGEASYDDMYLGIDQLASSLRRARFTDARTLKALAKEGFSTENFYLFTPANGTAVLPLDIWTQIGQEAFTGTTLPSEAVTYIVKLFEEKSWTVTPDTDIHTKVQDEVRGRIPTVVTQIPAGSRVIDKGEQVTTRHVAMLQAMNKAYAERRNLWHPMTLIGSLILSLLFVIISAGYLRMYLPSVFYSNKKLSLLLVVIILTLVIAKGTQYLILKTHHLGELVHYPLFVPFAAIVLCSLLNARIAAFASAFLAVLMAMTLAVDPAGFLVINLLAGLVAVLGTRRLRKRKEVFVVCAKAWACAVIVIIAFHCYDNTLLQLPFVADLISSFFFMLVTAILVVGLLPVFESMFRIITEITLMEFMDPTHPLLRRLSIEAPGTYQHSMVVGNLAEAAAIAIGANGLFCRVAVLYHDVGKLSNPQYFTENQQGPDVNIHALLTPQESAQVIMDHVPQGVQLARKHGLPESFVDIIKSHHGTTLVYYFYHKACEKLGEENVSEADFRYKGPKPRTKESAIIMIADTMEAASRSLEDPNEEAVTALVNRLVYDKVASGQFDECEITFEDLQKVKRSIVTSLVAALHTRVKYPTRPLPPGTAMPAEEA